METTRTPEGWSATLRPRGAARFVVAGFLGIWLCGWAFGEVTVLGILLHTVWLFFNPPPSPAPAPSVGGGAIVTGFLLLWLIFWTFGGIMAIRELLRALWSTEIFLVTPEGLTVTRWLGPFRSQKQYLRGLIQDFQLTRTNRRASWRLRIVVDSRARTIGTLGGKEVLEALRTGLRSELNLGPAAGESCPAAAAGSGSPNPTSVSALPALPPGWQETLSSEGSPVLMPAQTFRKAGAVILGLLACGPAYLAWSLGPGAVEAGSFPLVLLLLSGAVLVLVWGVILLAGSHIHWQIGSNRLVLQRVWPNRCKTLFEAAGLEIAPARDEDGDEWFVLSALKTWEEGPTIRALGHRRSLFRRMGDPEPVQRFAAWLVQRTGLPLKDLSTDEARGQEVERLRHQLAQSGTIGQWAARLLSERGARAGRR